MDMLSESPASDLALIVAMGTGYFLCAVAPFLFALAALWRYRPMPKRILFVGV